MIRKLLAYLAILTGVTIGVGIVDQPVEADHRPCSGITVVWDHPDTFTAMCRGYGENGWFRPRMYCMDVTWVVDNGVVVDKIYKFSGPHFGPKEHKAAREEADWSVARCPLSHPYSAYQIPGLRSRIRYWHG